MSEVEHPQAPSGKALKYALPECERRFLVACLPDQAIMRSVAITDRYLTGTRVRLRRMVETVDGRMATFFKLTQKIPAPDGAPGLLTTMYLSEAEYRVFAALPAMELRKIRHSMPPLGIDVFEAPLHGLTTAEAEFDSREQAASFAPPSLVVAEVTRDPRFTGGRLAVSSRDEVRQALAEYGVTLGE